MAHNSDFTDCRLCGHDFTFSRAVDVDKNALIIHCLHCDGYYEIPNRESQRKKLLEHTNPSVDKSYATNCRHCGAHFVMSSLMEEDKEQGDLVLHCSKCDNVYVLDNTDTQRKLLRGEKKGQPSQIMPVESVCQLIPGDVLAFERLRGLYHHHAIVVDVNRKTGRVKVVEFGASSQRLNGKVRKAAIVETTMDFKTDIAPSNAFVWRYMPLDCRPVMKVIETATKYANNPTDMPGYDAFANNCQHFASWCKTGVRESEEGWFYEKLSDYMHMGVDIVSGIMAMIPHPVAKVTGFVTHIGSKILQLAQKMKKRGLLKSLEKLSLTY